MSPSNLTLNYNTLDFTNSTFSLDFINETLSDPVVTQPDHASYLMTIPTTTIILVSLAAYQVIPSSWKILTTLSLTIVIIFALPDEYSHFMWIHHLTLFLTLALHAKQMESTGRLDYLWRVQAGGTNHLHASIYWIRDTCESAYGIYYMFELQRKRMQCRHFKRTIENYSLIFYRPTCATIS